MIIAGGRDYTDYAYVENYMSHLINKPDEIVDGTARGADRQGRRWARANGVTPVPFKPRTFEFGKAAMKMRNTDMANYATCLLAFWDGLSPGTAHMIREAKRLGLPYKVIRYDRIVEFDDDFNEIVRFYYY